MEAFGYWKRLASIICCPVFSTSTTPINTIKEVVLIILVIGLSFLGGAYMTEAFRSGLSTVQKIQKESAQSLGLSKGQIMRYIIFPQALSVSIPAIVANMIFLIKETSVFSGIALADLMFVSKDLIGLYYKTEEALLMLVISYLIMLLPLSILGNVLERRMRIAYV